MAETRPAIPRAIKDRVLREFNGRCAVCGGARAQIHHIDEDPLNHEVGNLIPLCSDCHLRDPHNPTARVDPAILALFRKYKDPTILSPQFVALHRRLAAVLSGEKPADMAVFLDRVRDLVDFVRHLRMGEYYAGRIQSALGIVAGRTPTIAETHAVFAKSRANRDEIHEVAIELLRYQGWRGATARRGALDR
jgi:hypothetical protein